MLCNRKAILLLFGVAVSLVKGVSAQTLTPGCWNMNANGYPLQLCITTVSTAGNIAGTVGQPGQQATRRIQGFWNETAKRIAFLSYFTATPSNASQYQYYSGSWFAESASNPVGLKRLAGTFVAFSGTGGTAVRYEVGWTATRN
jgi:hypothetical protein